MEAKEIAICTTTFYKQWFPGHADVQKLLAGDRAAAEGKIRGDLALETVQAVLQKGYKLVLIDGAAGSAFQEELARLGIPFQQERARGMSASRVQAFDEAYGDPTVRAVVWMEPEKVGMVEDIEKCAQPVIDGKAAIVVPGRSDAGWNSLPSYQRESERNGDRVFNDKLHRTGLLPEEQELDMYFGPRVYSALREYRSQLIGILHRHYSFTKKDTVPLHAAVNPGAYSEATFFPPVAALHEGLPVQGVQTGFAYPEQQRLLEEHPAFAEGENGYRGKRRAQLTGILTELVYYLRSIGRISGDSKRIERLA